MKNILVGAAFAFLALGATAAHAVSVGDTVTCGTADFPGIDCSGSGIVGDGSFSLYNEAFPLFNATFSNDELSISTAFAGGGLGIEVPLTLLFSDATHPITGFSSVSIANIQNLDASAVSLSNGVLSVDVSNTGWTSNPEAIITIDLTSAVPEPASWLLMTGGLGIVGGVMRSRRKSALAYA